MWNIYEIEISVSRNNVLLESTDSPHLLRLSQFSTESLKSWKTAQSQANWDGGSPGTQPGSLIYTLSVAAFMLQWQSWVVVVEAIWPTKPKLFTLRLFIEKVCGSLIKTKEESIIYLTRQGHVIDCYYYERVDQAYLFSPLEAGSFLKSKFVRVTLLLDSLQQLPIPLRIKPKDPTRPSQPSCPPALPLAYSMPTTGPLLFLKHAEGKPISGPSALTVLSVQTLSPRYRHALFLHLILVSIPSCLLIEAFPLIVTFIVIFPHHVTFNSWRHLFIYFLCPH